MAETTTNNAEQELISRAQSAISDCNWVVGECASEWTQKYARGRTDADFAALVGLTSDQAYQRRRVWETFGDVRGQYQTLKWSHFYVALNWDNAPECLQWADENGATVAEMKAWRRLQLGEDLTAPADDTDSLVSYVPTEPVEVREPAPFEGGGPYDMAGEAGVRQPGDTSATVAAAAREVPGPEQGAYAPFRQGAASVPASDGGATGVAERPEPSLEQIVKRMTSSFIRCQKAIDADFSREFRQLPEKTREKFFSAIDGLHESVDSLR